MTALLEHRLARRVAATAGVIGTLALAFFYILVPVLSVPKPEMYGFFVTWGVLVVLSLYWWSDHPWRTFALPIVGLVAVLAVLWFGGEYLGWVP